MTQDSPNGSSSTGRPRVAAVVGLTLLEVIRKQDLPSEILQDEDPTITMPRRLGLSDVIERQIRAYREDVRKSRRLTDDEVRDLVRLVIRRPDSEEVFFKAGRILAARSGSTQPTSPGWRSVLPAALSFALARRRAAGRLKGLFGRRLGGFGAGPFSLEARAHILIDSDPGGDACHFVTGLCEAVVRRYSGDQWRVAHDQCQSRRDAFCRWSVLATDRSRETESVGASLLSPEPGTG